MDGPRLHSLIREERIPHQCGGKRLWTIGDRLARCDVARASVRQTHRVVASFRKPGDYSLAVARSGFESTRMVRFGVARAVTSGVFWQRGSVSARRAGLTIP